MARLSLFFFCAAFLIGCARVSEPEIVTPQSVGHISPVLKDNSRYQLKRKVAIARFSNETVYGKSVLLGDNADKIGKQASDTLSTRLAESQKFILFETYDSPKFVAALESGDFSALKVPADYAIIGSVSEFGRETIGKVGIWSKAKEQKAYARVNVRLVDVKTGRVIFADSGRGEAISETGTVMGIGTQSGYDSTLNDKAISAAIGKVVGNLLENLLDQPWRSYVLAIEEKAGETFVVIAGGSSQGLSTGHRFSLSRRGKVVKNPQTGIPIELPGTPMAVLEAVLLSGKGIENETTTCRIVSGNLPPNVEFADCIVEEEGKP